MRNILYYKSFWSDPDVLGMSLHKGHIKFENKKQYKNNDVYVLIGMLFGI